MSDFRKNAAMFTFTTAQHDDFRQLVAEVDQDTRWGRVPANQVSFAPISEFSADTLSLADDVVYQDTVQSALPITVHLQPDDRRIAVRPYLLKNIKEHCGDKAAVLRLMLNQGAFADFCQHLNLGIPYLPENKELLYLTRGGKVSGWFSEYNANWSEGQQLDFVEASFRDAFPGMMFSGAEWSHCFMQSDYALADKATSPEFQKVAENIVTDAYLDIWEAAGQDRSILADAKPVARFTTGESGLQTISLSAMLMRPNGKPIILGLPLTVNHRGRDENVWGKFSQFPNEICALYQKGLRGLQRLCEYTVRHPYACMTKILFDFRASIPADSLREAAEAIEMFYPADRKDRTCTALELYEAVSGMVSAAAPLNGPVRRIQNEELLARLITTDWDRLDVATPVKLYGKSVSSIEDAED